MRAVLGVVSLLVALAVGAFVAKTQLRTPAVAGPAAVSASGGSVASEAKAVEEKAGADVTRALQEGARRNEDADR